MDVSLISMGKTLGKFPMLEHCCYALGESKAYHNEIILFFSALKEKKIDAEFYDGNLIFEEKILEKLKNNPPKKIVYYVYTPYIRHKKDFMKKLSRISKLYLVIVPYFWKEKILKEFPFIEDIFYDGEKGFNIDSKDTKIDYSKINLEPYLKKSPFLVIVSKYCPYQCTYCNAQKTGLLERNLKNVREEIIYLKKRGIASFTLSGNNLTINKKRFIEICEMMEELNVKWEGDGRVNHMNKEMSEALKKSKGTLLFGVESANQEILNKIKKNITIKQVIDNANILNKMKIPFRYTFMFGFPWDSYKTFKEMINLRKKLNAINYQCNFVSAYPGTPLFEEMKKLKLVDEKKLDFEDFSWLKMPLAPTLFLSKNDVKNLIGKIMVKGIFNTNVIKNILKKRKIKEYPKLFSRGIQLLIHGKRTWKG